MTKDNNDILTDKQHAYRYYSKKNRIFIWI